jgi:Tfp pilus assembly protein PilE
MVAIVGGWILLGNLAYSRYAERSHRTEAMNALGRLATAQAQSRLSSRTYANDLSALGFEGGCTENCVYLVSLDAAPDAQAYTARIAPIPAGGTNGVNQSGDEDCQWFTINALGIRAAENQRCLDGR